MGKRTDIHREGAVIPSDYDYRVSYALAGAKAHGILLPGINLDVVAKLHAEHPKAEYGCVGKCTLCGAHYLYGDVWQHKTTHELIHVGHDCADKVGFVADRSEYDGLRLALVEQMLREQKLQVLCGSDAALYDALENGEHPILVDMRRKLMKYGELTQKQKRFALHLRDEELHPAAKVEWVEIHGNTYPVKDKIKALGGRWDGYARVWKVPADKAAEAKALVEPPKAEEKLEPTVDVEAEAAALPF